MPTTWIEACPVEGACSECGLPFLWRDIMRRGHAWPGWNVEDAGGVLDCLRRCVRTAGMAFLPWRFWSRLHIEHPIRPRRLGSYGALVGFVMYTILIAAQGIIAHTRYGWAESWGQPTVSAGRAVAHAMLLPLSGRSAGMTVQGGVATAIDPPVEMIAFVWQSSAWLLVLAIGMAGFAPLGLLVLRPARRVARVRPWHVVRAGIYSLPWLTPAVVMASAAAVLRIVPEVAFRPWSDHLEAFLIGYVALLPAILFAWWWEAGSRHLRLRRPALAAGCVALASIAGGAGLLWLVEPQAFPLLWGRVFS